MTTGHAESFAHALQELESTRDVERFVSTAFAEEVTLLRPETGQQLRGVDGARRFWTQYLDRFETIRSEFDRVVEGEVGVLEWTSSGRLSGGAAIEYRGVSVLDLDDDGRVTRFVTYYDTAQFTVAGPAGHDA